MCGITGVIDFRSPSQLAAIEQMNNRVRHRGPDDEGFLFGNIRSGEWKVFGGPDTYPQLKLPKLQAGAAEGFQIALGSRRLSILDLSPAGHNPMSIADGKYWITYNGEIYNFVELRHELQQFGFTFNSETDTEVLLRAYEVWGVDCLARFNGMFAFALWDAEKKRLFCARDRLGIKPFHYYWDGKLFVFGSEIKSLLAHPGVRADPYEPVVYDYLVTGSLDHTDETFFEGIRRLPQANYGILDLETQDFHQQTYWRVEPNKELGDANSICQEKVDEFFDLFVDAVRMRLRSDVPVGTTLSGGLDSSSVVWAVNRLMRDEHELTAEIIGERQRTFTVYFDDETIDERRYVEQVVANTGVDAHLMTPTGPEALWNELETFQRFHDEPVSSTSQYAQWCVMRLAQQSGVRVILDGQGADEVLAGYIYYLGSLLAQTLREDGLLDFVRLTHRSADKVLRQPLFLAALGVYNALPMGLSRLFMGVGDRYFRHNTTVPLSMIEASFLANINGRATNIKNAANPNFGQHLSVNLMAHSMPALLRFEDRNSMAFSIEARVPYLDHRLVEYIFSLPAIYRVNDGWTKWVLRKSMDGKLPDEVIWRRGKLGFATPKEHWLQSGKDWLRGYLSKSEILSRRYLTQKAIDHFQGAQIVPGFWRALNLEVWLRTAFN